MSDQPTAIQQGQSTTGSGGIVTSGQSSTLFGSWLNGAEQLNGGSLLPNYQALYPQYSIPDASSVNAGAYEMPGTSALTSAVTSLGQNTDFASALSQGGLDKSFGLGTDTSNAALGMFQSITNGTQGNAAQTQFQQGLNNMLSGAAVSNTGAFARQAGNLAAQAGQQEMQTVGNAFDAYAGLNNQNALNNISEWGLGETASNDQAQFENGIQTMLQNISYTNKQAMNQYNSDIEKYNNHLDTTNLQRANMITSSMNLTGQNLMQGLGAATQVGMAAFGGTTPYTANAANSLSVNATGGVGTSTGEGSSLFGGTGTSAGYEMAPGATGLDAGAGAAGTAGDFGAGAVAADAVGTDAVVGAGVDAGSSDIAALIFA